MGETARHRAAAPGRHAIGVAQSNQGRPSILRTISKQGRVLRGRQFPRGGGDSKLEPATPTEPRSKTSTERPEQLGTDAAVLTTLSVVRARHYIESCWRHCGSSVLVVIALAITGCGGGASPAPPNVVGHTVELAVKELEDRGFQAVPPRGQFGFAVTSKLVVCNQRSIPETSRVALRVAKSCSIRPASNPSAP